MLPVIETDEGLQELEEELAALLDFSRADESFLPPPCAHKGRIHSADPVYKREYWRLYYLYRKLRDPDWRRKANKTYVDARERARRGRECLTQSATSASPD